MSIDIDKADYVIIANMRKLSLTNPAMWKMPIEDLKKIILPISRAEALYIRDEVYPQRQEIVNSLWPIFSRDCPNNRGDFTKKWLTDYVRSQGYSISVGMTVKGMFDALTQPPPQIEVTPIPELDEDQKACADTCMANINNPVFKLLISAGPGAGKTSTLCHLARAIAQAHPHWRILMLAFNVCAQATLTQRLKNHVPIISKSSCNDESKTGVCILTFDKFAAQCNIAWNNQQELSEYFDTITIGAAPAATTFSNYRTAMENAATNLDSYHTKFDVVIVDEAQDVTNTHSMFIEHFERRGAKIIAAGDPRQELYQGAIWYGNVWSRQAISPSPNTFVSILRYNHRSSKYIVDFLNSFSRLNFPTLHHDQISARGNAETHERVVCMEVDLESALQIQKEEPEYYPWKKMEKTKGNIGYFLDDPALGIKISEEMVTSDSCYALTPISHKKWRLETTTNQIRQDYYKNSDKSIILLDDMNDSKVVSAGDAVISNSKRIKGTERELVIVYGLDRNYSIIPRESLIKSMFVALSRARDKLILMIPRYYNPKESVRRGALVRTTFLGADVHDILNAVILEQCDVQCTTCRPLDGRKGIMITATSEESRKIENLDINEIECEITPAPSIYFDVENNDYDFVGIYIEMLIAQKFVDLLDFQIKYLVKHKRGNCSPEGCTKKCQKCTDKCPIQCDHYHKCTDKCPIQCDHWHICNINHDIVLNDNLNKIIYIAATKNNIADYKRDYGDHVKSIFDLARLKFSIENVGGLKWTVSDYLIKHCNLLDESIPPIYEHIIGLFPEGIKSVKYNELQEFVPHLHRPNNATQQFGAGRLCIRPDFIINDIPIEIKFTTEHKPSHDRQIIVYGSYLKSPKSYLYNVKRGEIHLYDKHMGHEYLSNISRSIIFSSLGLMRNAISDEKMPSKSTNRIRPVDKLTNTIIFVDTESENGLYTEIAAICCQLDGSILGYYHRIADGVVIGTSHTMESQLTNLRVADRTAHMACQSQMVSDFILWQKTIAPLTTIMHWAGSEARLADGIATVDVMNYYKVYNKFIGGTTGNGLEAAMIALFRNGDIEANRDWVPHRAFDDAIATAAVFFAITNFASV